MFTTARPEGWQEPTAGELWQRRPLLTPIQRLDFFGAGTIPDASTITAPAIGAMIAPVLSVEPPENQTREEAHWLHQ